MRKHQWVPVHKHTNPTDGGALTRPDVDGGGSVGGGGGGGGTGGPPTGLAGGDLFGSYPDPEVCDDSHSHTAATLPASIGGTHILLADGRGAPFTFDDVLQMDDGSDFMYADS